MLPPTMPMTVFFSDRLFASKIGKSTQASFVVMLIDGDLLTDDTLTPSTNSRAVAAQHHQGDRPADDRDDEDDDPVPELLRLPEHAAAG